MAHKRVLLCTALVAACYLVGVTWAETAALNTSISSNKTIVLNNAAVLAAPAASAVSNITAATALPAVIISSSATVAPKISANSKMVTAATTSNSSAATPKCVRDGSLLPHLAENGKELEICPDVKCQHEARNSTLIKVVVIIVIFIISILVIYMLFLMCLDPLLNKRVKANYQEHTNEDDDTTSNAVPAFPSANNAEMNARANVLNRVGHQQDKWKRQVREQRRHIYDRRTMLN